MSNLVQGVVVAPDKALRGLQVVGRGPRFREILGFTVGHPDSALKKALGLRKLNPKVLRICKCYDEKYYKSYFHIVRLSCWLSIGLISWYAFCT